MIDVTVEMYVCYVISIMNMNLKYQRSAKYYPRGHLILRRGDCFSSLSVDVVSSESESSGELLLHPNLVI